jgi:hypothetical protein
MNHHSESAARTICNSVHKMTDTSVTTLKPLGLGGAGLPLALRQELPLPLRRCPSPRLSLAGLSGRHTPTIALDYATHPPTHTPTTPTNKRPTDIPRGVTVNRPFTPPPLSRRQLHSPPLSRSPPPTHLANPTTPKLGRAGNSMEGLEEGKEDVKMQESGGNEEGGGFERSVIAMAAHLWHAVGMSPHLSLYLCVYFCVCVCVCACVCMCMYACMHACMY